MKELGDDANIEQAGWVVSLKCAYRGGLNRNENKERLRLGDKTFLHFVFSLTVDVIYYNKRPI